MAGRERAMQVRWGCWLGILCLVAGCAVEEGGVGPGPRAVAPAANVAWAWQESATPAVRTASIAAIGAEVDWVVLCGDVERLAREMALPEAWRQQAPAWRAQWTAEVQRLTGLDLSQASPLGAAGLGPGAAVAYDGAREVWLVELSLADREAFRAWVKAWSGGAPLSWPPGVDEPTLRAHFAPFSLGGRYAPWRVVVVEGRDSGVILVSEAGDAALWQNVYRMAGLGGGAPLVSDPAWRRGVAAMDFGDSAALWINVRRLLGYALAPLEAELVGLRAADEAARMTHALGGAGGEAPRPHGERMAALTKRWQLLQRLWGPLAGVMVGVAVVPAGLRLQAVGLVADDADSGALLLQAQASALPTVGWPGPWETQTRLRLHLPLDALRALLPTLWGWDPWSWEELTAAVGVERAWAEEVFSGWLDLGLVYPWDPAFDHLYLPEVDRLVALGGRGAGTLRAGWERFLYDLEGRHLESVLLDSRALTLTLLRDAHAGVRAELLGEDLLVRSHLVGRDEGLRFSQEAPPPAHGLQEAALQVRHRFGAAAGSAPASPLLPPGVLGAAACEDRSEAMAAHSLCLRHDEAVAARQAWRAQWREVRSQASLALGTLTAVGAPLERLWLALGEVHLDAPSWSAYWATVLAVPPSAEASVAAQARLQASHLQWWLTKLAGEAP